MPQDHLIGTMILLKSLWSLTGSLAVNQIKFTTGFYQEQTATPQVSITPLIETHKVLSIGATPVFRINKKIHIMVTVRPDTYNQSSVGIAKNSRYRIAQEVERILRTYPAGASRPFARTVEFYEKELLHLKPPTLLTDIMIELTDFGSANFGLPLPSLPGIFDPLLFEPNIYQ